MELSTRIKQFIYPLYILTRSNPWQRKKLRGQFQHYRQQAIAGIQTDHRIFRLKRFSSLDEDGIILWIMASLGIDKGRFLDIGANDCINSNCANLALNFGWDGVFIDSDQRLLNIGRKNYRLFRSLAGKDLQFVCSFVTPQNINRLIIDTVGNAEIDLVSIDIDGNDYAIFKAIDAIRPKCYVVENRIELGAHDIVVPPGDALHAGASITAMTKLAEQKGYTLIAANRYGFNTFYLRNDLVSGYLPPLSIDSVLKDPDVSKDFYDDHTMQNLLQRYNSAQR